MRAWFGLVVAVLVACDRPAPAPELEPRRSATSIRRPSAEQAAPLHFIERVTGGATAGDRLPLIVAIHGLGDSPQSFSTLLEGFDVPARIVYPQGPIDHHGGYSWFVFDREDAESTSRGIERAAEQVAALIRWLSAHRSTAGNAIVTGFSQGGMLSFALAVRYPTSVAEAFPVGGWLPPSLYPKRLGTAAPPIVALHGGDDVRVPLGPTEASVKALRSRGYRAELKVYSGVGHSISREERGDLIALLRDACARRVELAEPVEE